MSEGVSGQLWFFIDVILVCALAGGLIYGMVQWRRWRKHPVAAAKREEKTKELFRDPGD
jgi:hypothetical protein